MVSIVSIMLRKTNVLIVITGEVIELIEEDNVDYYELYDEEHFDYLCNPTGIGTRYHRPPFSPLERKKEEKVYYEVTCNMRRRQILEEISETDDRFRISHLRSLLHGVKGRIENGEGNVVLCKASMSKEEYDRLQGNKEKERGLSDE